MEKWVKALHSESEGSWLKPRLPLILVLNKYQTVIKMELVTMSLNSGPELDVGQSIAWWSGLPGDQAIGGNFVFCLIIVVIPIGLGRACRLGGGIWSYKMGGKPRRDGTIFMGEFDPSWNHEKILIWEL